MGRTREIFEDDRQRGDVKIQNSWFTVFKTQVGTLYTTIENIVHSDLDRDPDKMDFFVESTIVVWRLEIIKAKWGIKTGGIRITIVSVVVDIEFVGEKSTGKANFRFTPENSEISISDSLGFDLSETGIAPIGIEIKFNKDSLNQIKVNF